jgi:hypothetical protein
MLDRARRGELERAAQGTGFRPPGQDRGGVKPGGTNPVKVNNRGAGTPTSPEDKTSLSGSSRPQPKQTTDPRNYLEVAAYGQNPLMDAMTTPATEEAKQRFFGMGGIQTIRGTMAPDKRPSVGWWNPNTLREHGTIQEGMLGVDYGQASDRYKTDAEVWKKVEPAKIESAAKIEAAKLGLLRPVAVKSTDLMGNETESLAYPDPSRIGTGGTADIDEAQKVFDQIQAARTVEEQDEILERQAPSVKEMVKRIQRIMALFEENQNY